jgi:hypothetical protein
MSVQSPEIAMSQEKSTKIKNRRKKMIGLILGVIFLSFFFILYSVLTRTMIKFEQIEMNKRMALYHRNKNGDFVSVKK